uniref:BTB domain-containing protein n=1 Tax=Steinernema glaseri TaxID=37863 RepID=A0A1I8AB01_9BILA
MSVSPLKRPQLRKQPIVEHIDLSTMLYGDARVPEKHSDVDSLLEQTPVVSILPEKIKSSFTDYTKPDESRPLEVRIQGKSLFVNPDMVNGLSPMLTNFLVRERVAGKTNRVDVQLEEVNYEDMLRVLQVLCPTVLGLFPKPIEASNFIHMAKLSYKFKIPRLRAACELFVSKMSLAAYTFDQFSAFLNVSCKYGLQLDASVRLLEGVLGQTNEHTRFYLDVRTSTLVHSMILKAANLYLKGYMHHGAFEDRARLKVPCRTCRAQWSPNSLDHFVVCVDCKTTICTKCVAKPCAEKIRRFVEGFAKAFGEASRELHE